MSDKKIAFFVAIVSLIMILHNAVPLDGKVKLWRWTNDIRNPTNWWHSTKKNPPSNSNCWHTIHTFVFAAHNTAPIFIGDQSVTVVTALILPLDGTIYLNPPTTTGLQFAPSPDTNAEDDECTQLGGVAHLKPLIYRNWYSPANWLEWKEGEPGDLAIPPLERLPCRQDDVILPHTSIAISIYKPHLYWLVNSITIGGGGGNYSIYDDNEDFQRFTSTFLGRKVFYTGDDAPAADLVILPQEQSEDCSGDPWGCICQPELDRDTLCKYMLLRGEEQKENDLGAIVNCLDPVRPYGFCRNICGAYIHLGINQQQQQQQQIPIYSNLHQLRSMLMETVPLESVDFHVSRSSEHSVQIVFRDHSENGGGASSTSAATKIYDVLLAHWYHRHFATNTTNISVVRPPFELYVSGPPILHATTTTTTFLTPLFGWFLGSGLAVSIVFILMFHFSGYNIQNPWWWWDCGRTVRVQGWFRAVYRPHPEIDDEHCLITTTFSTQQEQQQQQQQQQQQMEESFDNPMFDKDTTTCRRVVDNSDTQQQFTIFKEEDHLGEEGSSADTLFELVQMESTKT